MADAPLDARSDHADTFASPPGDARPFGPPCPGCGRARTAADAAGVAWSSWHHRGGVEFVCPTCTRADLRQIEAGLVYDTVRRAG